MSTRGRGMIYSIHNYVHQRERYDLLHPQLFLPEGKVWSTPSTTMSTWGRVMIYSIYDYVHLRERYDLLHLQLRTSTRGRGMIYSIFNYVHQREKYDLLYLCITTIRPSARDYNMVNSHLEWVPRITIPGGWVLLPPWYCGLRHPQYRAEFLNFHRGLLIV
jgi:hypothetical protein